MTKHKYVFRLNLVTLFLLLSLLLLGCKKEDKDLISDTLGEHSLTITPIATPAIPNYTLTNDSLSTQTIPASEEEIEEDINQVTLLAVGDNLVHDQVIHSGLQEDGTYNYDHLFSQLKDEFIASDISIINQETILGGELFPYTGYPVFNTPVEMGDAIFNAGFDVVLHATNHTMDRGEKAVFHTLDFWKKYPEITVLGINESKEARESIPVITKNGIRIAMLNYTYGLNGYSLPKDKPYLVNMLTDQEQMKEDIKRAKEISDFVIVFPHWGTEYVYEADKNQINLTNFFADLEVDLVIGTHPHVVEPVEWITTETGHKMLVYYSLGNYVSYQKEAPRMLGGMAKISLVKEEGEVVIEEASITPIITHYEESPHYSFGVYKLRDYTLEQSLRHGVIELQKNSNFSLLGTKELAQTVLGEWIK